MKPLLANDLCYMCGVAEKQVYSQEGFCKDCEELHDRVIAALRQARQDGCLRQGYDPSGWRDIPNRSWTEHVLTHMAQYRRGDTTEDHLSHAICCLVMIYDDRHLL